MRIFLDTSALAKRYVFESGSDAVERMCSDADEIILSSLCLPETISAFNRLRREKRITTKIYNKLKRDLILDMDAATVIDIDYNVIIKAIACLEKAPLRTLDAIQLATALEVGNLLFISGDKRQCLAAKFFRLKVKLVG